MPKLITVRSYDPIAADKNYRQPWSDVWISFTGKPGRKRFRFGPTLVALPALIQDVELARSAGRLAQLVLVRHSCLTGQTRMSGLHRRSHCSTSRRLPPSPIRSTVILVYLARTGRGTPDSDADGNEEGNWPLAAWRGARRTFSPSRKRRQKTNG